MRRAYRLYPTKITMPPRIIATSVTADHLLQMHRAGAPGALGATFRTTLPAVPILGSSTSCFTEESGVMCREGPVLLITHALGFVNRLLGRGPRSRGHPAAPRRRR